MDGDGIGAGNIDGELDVLSLEKTADIAFRILTGDFLKEHIPHLIVAAEILYFVESFQRRRLCARLSSSRRKASFRCMAVALFIASFFAPRFPEHPEYPD